MIRLTGSASLGRLPGAPRAAAPAARDRARLSWYEHLRGTLVSATIVRLDGRVEAETSELPAERMIAGNPEVRLSNYFTDPSQQFFAGRWSASRGKWRVRYSENELCVMTSGRVTLESDTGERSSFGPGEAFVVPAGFVGTWEVVEDCSKIYAVFEARR